MNCLKSALRLVKSERGQQTVEFLLMLGAVVTFVLAFTITFHKEIAGGFFTVIGKILG